jgi:hypothetical protein
VVVGLACAGGGGRVGRGRVCGRRAFGGAGGARGPGIGWNRAVVERAIAAGVSRCGWCAACDPICRRWWRSCGRGIKSLRRRRGAVWVGALRIGRRRAGPMGRHRVGLPRPSGALSRHFGNVGRPRDRGFRSVGGRGVLDDLSRRVGVLAKRAATALSWVGVVCHDGADYQSGAIGEDPEDPPTTMDPQPGWGCGSIVVQMLHVPGLGSWRAVLRPLCSRRFSFRARR